MKTRFRKYLESVAKMQTPQEIAANLRRHFPALRQDITIGEAEAVRVHVAALQGEQWAYDRLFGRARQDIDLTTGGDKISAPTINVVSTAGAQAVQKIIDGET